MGTYLNPDNSKFQESINSDIYVDKTGLITYTNSVIHTAKMYLCQPATPVWKIYGRQYAFCILQPWL